MNTDPRVPSGESSSPKSSVTSDSLVSAIAERLSTETARAGIAVRLALAEARLAASSAGLLLVIVLLGTATLLVSWLLLLALLAHTLVFVLDMSVTGALVLLLLLHLLVVFGLLMVGRRLIRHLTFEHTRRTLAPTPPDPASEPESSTARRKSA